MSKAAIREQEYLIRAKMEDGRTVMRNDLAKQLSEAENDPA